MMPTHAYTEARTHARTHTLCACMHACRQAGRHAGKQAGTGMQRLALEPSEDAAMCFIDDDPLLSDAGSFR